MKVVVTVKFVCAPEEVSTLIEGSVHDVCYLEHSTEEVSNKVGSALLTARKWRDRAGTRS